MNMANAGHVAAYGCELVDGLGVLTQSLRRLLEIEASLDLVTLSDAHLHGRPTHRSVP